MSVSVYFILLTSLVISVYYFFTRNYNYWKKRGIAGPKPEFLFGNLKEVVLQRKSVNVEFTDLYNEYPKEKIVGLYRLSAPMLLVRDLDVIQHVMIKDFDNFVDRGSQKFGNEGLSKNLFMTNGEDWRVLRTRLSPVFTSGKLKNMFHLLNERGDKFLEHIDLMLKKSEVENAYTLVQKYTISTISACAFGLDIDLNNYDQETFTKLDKLIFTPNYLIDIENLFPGILNYVNIPVFPAAIKKFFYNLVETTVHEREGKSSKRNDFMDLLFELRNAGEIKGRKKYENDNDHLLKITDDLIAAQALVFYAGGYETSATTVSFLLHELAQDQNIQNKVVSEINDVIGRNNNKITYESMKEMTYLTQVFDETLRIYPIVDPLNRMAKSSFKIPGTDVTIEKDTMLAISVRGIHHDEKYYPEPHKFDPDRFSPANVKSRHPCAYLPFGLGPRNCIGMRFAKVQSFLLVVKLLQRYRVEPATNTTRQFTYDGNRVILSSKNGYPLKIVPRY